VYINIALTLTGDQMQTYRSFYEHELTKLLTGRIEEQRNIVAAGHLPDHAAYKEATGVIKGLQMALEDMMEADRICQGGERDN
jgi:hypothetical protein